MINVQDVASDWELQPPEPFTILRSTGKFVNGGFESSVFPTTMFGPVQQASNKEISMLPEADRIGSILAFWATVVIHTTQGYAPAPSTHGEVLAGAVPGTVYTSSTAPPSGAGTLYVNGLALTPGADYSLSGLTVTLVQPTTTQAPYFTWPVTVNAQAAASDIIQYEGFNYRVLQTYLDSGSGYWKALGTRMEAA